MCWYVPAAFLLQHIVNIVMAYTLLKRNNVIFNESAREHRSARRESASNIASIKEMAQWRGLPAKAARRCSCW